MSQNTTSIQQTISKMLESMSVPSRQKAPAIVLLQRDGDKRQDASFKKKRQAKKKSQYLANKARRASLYTQHTGSNGWQKDVSTWHETLRALSAGTA